jgi:hypothetical protein
MTRGTEVGGSVGTKRDGLKRPEWALAPFDTVGLEPRSPKAVEAAPMVNITNTKEAKRIPEAAVRPDAPLADMGGRTPFAYLNLGDLRN